MLHLYFDESGCLGFDFSKNGTSKHFTLCVLVVEGVQNNKHLKTSVNRTLRNKINRKRKKKATELKGSKDSLQTKTYFIQQLDGLKVDYQVYALTLNKKRVNGDLKRRPDRLYNYLVSQLLKKLSFLNNFSSIHFVFDRCKSPKQVKDINQYLFSQLSSALNTSIKLNFEHKDSQSDRGLSAIDYFCNGIFRKYESKDRGFFDLFKEKIGYEDVFLP